MDRDEYEKLREFEGSHYYYRALHRLILDLVAEHTGGRDLRILEAGCGTGLLATKLAAFGRVRALDYDSLAIAYSRERGLDPVQASVNAVPFDDEAFDLITCIDVLYHQQVDDRRAARELYRVLAPGGKLILRVPANDRIRTQHDRNVHTRQRYDRRNLAGLLAAAGFTIERLSYTNLLLLPPALLLPGSSIQQPPAAVNDLLTGVLNLENRVMKRVNLPQGLGLIGVAARPLQEM